MTNVDVEVKAPLTPPPLSYSSMNEILGCEQKYALRKVLKVEPDEDYSKETDAMDVGSVFHECLEECNHDLSGFAYTALVSKIAKYPSLEKAKHAPLLWAMLRRYKLLHVGVGLKVKAVETELLDEKMYRGYVDLVLEEDAGYWITDLKTAASISRFLESRLANDRQLNLYLHWYEKLVDLHKPILGCRYRVVTKAKLKRRKDETFKQFSERLYQGIKAYEYVIPIDLMDPESAMITFKKIRKRQVQLHKNGIPTRNFNHCDSYFRPCEYWSRCHKKQFTDDFGIVERVF